MKTLRLNADYEYELFTGKKASPILNESIEFLLFFHYPGKIFSYKTYPQSYLDHVKYFTGQKLQLTKDGEYENFWGKLKNKELEIKLNSKLTSAQFQEGVKLISSENELKTLPIDGSLLLKDPYGMSGQNVFRYTNPAQIKSYPLLAEKFRNRVVDFSLFRFPNGEVIYYENIVNERFQYKGTVIKNDCHFEGLSFISKISQIEIDQYQAIIKKVIDYYSSFETEACFSVDSFVYEEEGIWKIQSVCEVNYRRTMGSMAYELIKRYSPNGVGKMLLLPNGAKPLFLSQHELENKMVLSPGNTRFEIILDFTDDT